MSAKLLPSVRLPRRRGWRWLDFALAVVGAIAPILLQAGRTRENTEWETAYWYNANDHRLPRVLLLGDSIVRGYEGRVRDELAGVAFVSYWATSKCVTDPTYLKQLDCILEEYPYAVIHFNNGLHSLRSDPQEWAAALRETYTLIRSKAPHAKVIWASITPVNDLTRNEKVRLLNAVGARLARERKVEVDDLFTLMDPLDRGTYWTDVFHFGPEGRARQATQVTAVIRAALGGRTAGAAEAAAALKGAESETGPQGAIQTGRAK